MGGLRTQGGSLSLRLLFVIKSLAGTGGGAERVLSALTGELASRGHEIHVATFDAVEASDFYALDPRIVRHRLGIGMVDRSSGALSVLRRAAALRRLVRSYKPTVAIGFMHSGFVPLGLASMGTGIPVIASEHTAYDHYRAFSFQGAVVRATAALFATFTATSERVRAGFPRSIGRRMAVIPNPVIFPDAPITATGNKVLLSVGGLRAEKGHGTLIAAFARLADRFPDWTLRIVGDGPRRRALQTQTEMAKLQGQVRFAGIAADVTREYAAADLFVIPSSYESFGLATAEALAAGVPAVGFADCPGTNEIIQEEVNGLLVSGPERVEALAEGLARLMSDDGLRARLGAAGPASVAKYSLKSVTDQWEELLKSVSPR